MINIETFLELSGKIPVLDVRSPVEYDHAHIPGALNFPLFTNQEREKVGICYKENGRENAILLGLEIIGPKMAEMARNAKEIAKENKIIVHCWRGGMRSSSMSWLLSTIGLETYTLEGGYKTYRRFVKSCFEKKYNLVVLGGMTGSAKTEILKEMDLLGVQVIDLENLANHKGSAFGALGQKEQCSTEQFENNLFEQLVKVNPEDPLWVEDESQTIGKIWIPEEIFTQMRNTKVIRINVPRDKRIKWLVSEYGSFGHDLLKDSILKIRKRIGGLNFNLALNALENNHLEKVVDIVLEYYDKTYQYGLSHRNQDDVHLVELEEINHQKNAERIIGFFGNIKK